MKQNCFLILFLFTGYYAATQPGNSQDNPDILADKDSLAILFHTQGCFHSSASKIVIQREAEKYIARLYEVTSYVVHPKRKPAETLYITGALVKIRILTAAQLQDLIRFRKELTISRPGYCTTTDKYIINTKYGSHEISDGSCSWGGYYALQRSFFGDTRTSGR